MFNIYEIRNIITDFVYYGVSKEVPKRWVRHKRELKGGKHHSIHLQRAWNKYGAENFSFTVIESYDTEEAAYHRETALIESTSNVYNVARQNFYGGTIDEETRKKISISVKEAFKRPEVIAKLGKKPDGWQPWCKGMAGHYPYPSAQKGVKKTEEHCQKMSITMKAKYANGYVNPQLGAKHDDERRRRNQVAQSTKVWSGFVDPSGNKIPPFKNLTQFSKDNGLQVQGLFQLQKGQKKQYKGWTYDAQHNDWHETD
jgi:group I intron endonuclease